jgi:hypothetical protein
MLRKPTLRKPMLRDPMLRTPLCTQSVRVAGWIVVAVVGYPLSIVPAIIVASWLEHWGMDLERPFSLLYAPVIWTVNNVDWADRLSALIYPAMKRLMP